MPSDPGRPRKETGSSRWPFLNFGYMTALAYVGAVATSQLGTALGPLIMDWQTPVAVAIAPLADRYALWRCSRALWPLAQKPRRKPVASADSQLLQIESPDRS